MSLINKVVLVTGAGSGIGAAAAIKFAKRGANIAIIDKTNVNINVTAAECYNIGSKPMLIKADISVDEKAKGIIEKTIEAFGKIDVLINNAGIFRDGKILSDNFMETYDEVIGTNLRALLHLTHLAAPHLIKTKGNIVKVSSVCSFSVLGGQYVAYSVSKAGTDHFTRVAAMELAHFGVRVNAVNPGIVKTNIFDNAGMNWNFEADSAQAPLKRVSEPGEIADLITYLASDKAKGITGATYVIDNGICVKN